MGPSCISYFHSRITQDKIRKDDQKIREKYAKEMDEKIKNMSIVKVVHESNDNKNSKQKTFVKAFIPVIQIIKNFYESAKLIKTLDDISEDGIYIIENDVDNYTVYKRSTTKQSSRWYSFSLEEYDVYNVEKLCTYKKIQA